MYSKSEYKISEPTGSKFGANYEVFKQNTSGSCRFLAMELTDRRGGVNWEAACALGVEGEDEWFLPSEPQWRLFAAAFKQINGDNYNSVFGLSKYYWSSTYIKYLTAYDAWFEGSKMGQGNTSSPMYARLSTWY